MITLIRKISTIAISFTLIFCSVAPAFAEPTEEQYQYISNKSEAVAAIQAYLNSRGLGVICDVDKGADEWLINQQIELQELFSGIEKTAGGILKFRYDYAVLQKLNSFVGDLVTKFNFAEFNDSNESQESTAYSGDFVTDSNGYQCLVYTINSNGGVNSNSVNYFTVWDQPDSFILSKGSFYKYVRSSFSSVGSHTIDLSFVSPVTLWTDVTTAYLSSPNSRKPSGNYSALGSDIGGGSYAFWADNDLQGDIIVFRTLDNYYYVGAYQYNPYYSVNYRISFIGRRIMPSAVPVDIKVYTPKGVSPAPEPNVPVIPKDSEGNTYNYNNYQTYIDNSVTNNTTYYPSSDEEPEEPDNPTVPDFPGGTWNPDGNGGYDFDFDLPDFSGINWSLNGNSISQKFPFSIPWDLMAFFSVLNAEPETPELQGEIDLGIVTWDIDWNLHQFDGIAAIARNMEFIAFCIGLILATRSLIKG